MHMQAGFKYSSEKGRYVVGTNPITCMNHTSRPEARCLRTVPHRCTSKARSWDNTKLQAEDCPAPPAPSRSWSPFWGWARPAGSKQWLCKGRHGAAQGQASRSHQVARGNRNSSLKQGCCGYITSCTNWFHGGLQAFCASNATHWWKKRAAKPLGNFLR